MEALVAAHAALVVGQRVQLGFKEEEPPGMASAGSSLTNPDSTKGSSPDHAA